MSRNGEENYDCDKNNADHVELSRKPPLCGSNNKPGLVVNVLISEKKNGSGVQLSRFFF